MERRTLILMLALFLAALGASTAAAGPLLTLAETRFDFGTVNNGSRPVHVFEIANTGDAVLEITKVQST